MIILRDCLEGVKIKERRGRHKTSDLFQMRTDERQNLRDGWMWKKKHKG